LVKKEADFLKPGEKVLYASALLGQFESERVAALALKYVKGRPALASDDTRMPQIVGGWLGSGASVLIGQTEAWLALERKMGSEPLFARLSERLRGLAIPPTVQHGDFTPWNVRVDERGDWTVLDWECGQQRGIPGWDWLPYVIQPEILVKHRRPEEIVASMEELFQREDFQAYAAKAGIAEREREVAAAYLLYMVEVIRPSEGLAESSASGGG